MPCSGSFQGCVEANKYGAKRFHFTCLFCRHRRKALGKYKEPPFYINYAYLGLPKYLATAFKIDKERRKAYRFTLMVPQILKIDPRGHFTALRCAAIMFFDKIMLKFEFTRARLANLCELLANYPTF